MCLRGWFKCRLAIYAVIATEGLYLGWIVLLTLLAILVFEMVHRAGHTKDIIFRDLPFEILQSPDASEGLTVTISTGTLVGCGAFILIHCISIGCIMIARQRRSYKHFIFPLIWIFLYSGLMVGGLTHGIKEIEAMPKELPEPPVIAMKMPPMHPDWTTIYPPKRITLPPIPAPPEAIQQYFRDSMEKVCGLLLQIILLKCILGLYSLITIVVHMRMYRNQVGLRNGSIGMASKPTYV